jgi:hypothetical protein
MTSSLTRLSIVGAALLLAGATSFAAAQTPGVGRQGSPMYDVTTETTMTGTVESVQTIAGPDSRGRRGLGGTHLVLRAETEKLEVHLGPTAYLAEQHVRLAKGDVVEILGSRIAIDDTPVLLARQITKGGERWTLRDATGRPLWSGGR